jgi:hypothetical protein
MRTLDWCYIVVLGFLFWQLGWLSSVIIFNGDSCSFILTSDEFCQWFFVIRQKLLTILCSSWWKSWHRLVGWTQRYSPTGGDIWHCGLLSFDHWLAESRLRLFGTVHASLRHHVNLGKPTLGRANRRTRILSCYLGCLISRLPTYLRGT